jgi:hypothetical protein
MKNAVDDTETINGSDYYFDYTPTTEGRYLVWTSVQLNGNSIRRVINFRVANDGFSALGKIRGGPA